MPSVGPNNGARVHALGTRAIPIYLVCFHSRPGPLRGTGQYLSVETAIQQGEWPYDNGDDPSFYVARSGGPLTWGVCRQDVRNAIVTDSIVVFFSFTTPAAPGQIVYRLCAVATVEDKLDHRALHFDPRFDQFRHIYINGLIRPEDDGWRHDETDRPYPDRHKDWLWRIADHRRITQNQFNKTYAPLYEQEGFPNNAIEDGMLRLAYNYIVFSKQPDRTFISPNPPIVANAHQHENYENWINQQLREMTVGMATRRNRRDRHLRILNPFRPHRQIRFEMPADDVTRWRDTLIAVLREAA